MRRFLILFLCLVFLISVFAVPAFAITADDMATSLQSGWTSTYPTGYSSSWFYRVITLLKTIDSNVDSIEYKIGSLVTYSSGIYQNLGTVQNDVSTIKSTLSDIKIAVNGVKSSVDLVKTSVDNMKSSVDNVKSSVDSMKTTLSSIGTDIGLIESDVDTIRSEVVSIDSTTTTISSNLSDVKSKVTDIELNTDYLKSIDLDTANLAELSTSLQTGSWLTSSGSVNWFKVLFNATSSINTNVSKLASLYATDTDFQIKQSQADEEQAVLGALTSSNRVDDISGLSGFSGDMKDFFAMDDVDIGLMFGQVESGYSSWFSMNTARALAVGGGASAVSGAVAVTYGLDRAAYEEPETPYLDASNAEVAGILAGGNP